MGACCYYVVGCVYLLLSVCSGQCLNLCDRSDANPSSPDDLVAMGSATVVLGFRHPKKDFLYEADWNYFLEHSIDEQFKSRSQWRLLRFIRRMLGWKEEVKRPWILSLMTAFSRYWPDKTVYVQDALEEQAAKVSSILVSDAIRPCTVIVSGRSVPMPSQVVQACQDILTEQIPLSHNRAVQYLESMKRNKQLVFDTWG